MIRPSPKIHQLLTFAAPAVGRRTASQAGDKFCQVWRQDRLWPAKAREEGKRLGQMRSAKRSPPPTCAPHSVGFLGLHWSLGHWAIPGLAGSVHPSRDGGHGHSLRHVPVSRLDATMMMGAHNHPKT